MKRMAIVLGAVSVTAALAPLLPSTAYGATGHFDYITSSGFQSHIANPVTGQCYKVQGGHGDANNGTDAHAQLFPNTTCQDDPGKVIMNPHERSPRGGVPPFGSVKFV